MGGERDVNVFGIGTDGSDQTLGEFNSRALQRFILRGIRNQRGNSLPNEALCPLLVVVDQEYGSPATLQFVDHALTDTAGAANNVMATESFNHALSPFAAKIVGH